MKTAIFYWDWKETPPIAEIVRASGRIKRARAYVAEAGDTYVLVVAATKAEAKEAWENIGNDSEVSVWKGNV